MHTDLVTDWTQVLALYDPGLDGYHVFHAVRADLLARLDRAAEADSAYDRAISLTENDAERAHLQRRRSATS